jgi:hypothetical protein
MAPLGIVLFSHGSGSSRFSPRNQYVARAIQQAGFTTLLLDLLTAAEESDDAGTGRLRFDVGLLAERLVGASEWVTNQAGTADLPLGYFGASTGAAAAYGGGQTCEDEVVGELMALRRRAAHYARLGGRVAEDDLFAAEQNARLVANAERYYRAMFRGRIESWNLRDRHMAETMEALAGYLARHTYDPGRARRPSPWPGRRPWTRKRGRPTSWKSPRN